MLSLYLVYFLWTESHHFGNPEASLAMPSRVTCETLREEGCMWQWNTAASCFLDISFCASVCMSSCLGRSGKKPLDRTWVRRANLTSYFQAHATLSTEILILSGLSLTLSEASGCSREYIYREQVPVRQTALNLVPLMSTEKPQTKNNARVEEILVDDERPYSAEKGDEALDLVGAERSAQFSDEYFLKLRRKLVRASAIRRSCTFSPSLPRIFGFHPLLLLSTLHSSCTLQVGAAQSFC
jgi:hypothetical protein